MTGARATFVYFVTTADLSLVKIGWTADPAKRLSALLGSSPIPLQMIVSVPGSRWDEYALHRRYLAQHSHYEWFRSTPEMLADIETVARAGAVPSDWRNPTNLKNPLHNLGVRGTPEWRAKMKNLHRSRWDEVRRANNSQAKGRAQ